MKFLKAGGPAVIQPPEDLGAERVLVEKPAADTPRPPALKVIRSILNDPQIIGVIDASGFIRSHVDCEARAHLEPSNGLTYLPLCLSPYLPVYLSTCPLSTFLPFYLSIYLHI